jgi:hypothetical protein
LQSVPLARGVGGVKTAIATGRMPTGMVAVTVFVAVSITDTESFA